MLWLAQVGTTISGNVHMKRPNSATRKVLGRAIGGSLGGRLTPRTRTPQPSAGQTTSRNEKLDAIARAYQQLGMQSWATLPNAQTIRASVIRGFWTSATLLQPAHNALLRIGIVPKDATVGALLAAIPLTIKEGRKILYYGGDPAVTAKRIAGRVRGLKRNA